MKHHPAGTRWVGPEIQVRECLMNRTLTLELEKLKAEAALHFAAVMFSQLPQPSWSASFSRRHSVNKELLQARQNLHVAVGLGYKGRIPRLATLPVCTLWSRSAGQYGLHTL